MKNNLIPSPKSLSFKHALVGLGKEVKYRPFKNREQKQLLLAKDSTNSKDILDAFISILDECTFNELDVGNIPYFDALDLFVRIRARSVSNEVTLVYAEIDNDGKKTGQKATTTINLDDVKVKTTEGHSKIVKLDENISLKMQYPTLNDLKNNGSKGTLDSNDRLIIKSCIECIFTNDEDDEPLYVKDLTDEDFVEWFDDLDYSSTQDIKKFFDTMPNFNHTVTILLPTLKESRNITLRSIEDFFM